MIKGKKTQRLYKKEALRSGDDEAAGVLSARGLLLRFSPCRTSAGASTSFITR